MTTTAVIKEPPTDSASVETRGADAGAGDSHETAETPVITPIVIAPSEGWSRLNLREMIRYRELLYFLTWRDVKVRYKQTVFGLLWAILVPVLTAIVQIAIFGHIANFKDEFGDRFETVAATTPSTAAEATAGAAPTADLASSTNGADATPGAAATPAETALPVTKNPYFYQLWVFAGVLPWTLFAAGLQQGSMSLVSQQHLLTKIYFPRLFVPAASVGGALVDMGFSFLVMLGLLAVCGVVPAATIFLLPVLVVLLVISALGVTYTLAALTVTYRDFRFVIPFMTQMWLFLSPMGYPLSSVERYRYVFCLNPLVGVMEGFRSAIFGLPMPWDAFLVSSLVAVALFAFGVMYFRRTERRFADIA